MTLAPRRIAVVLLAVAAISACVHSDKVEVRDAWANATPPGATVAAVYLEVTAADDDALLSATTTVADRIEMHASSEENGMMRMRPLPTVELKPGETFVFAPGGAHLMLLGLRQPLAARHAVSSDAAIQKCRHAHRPGRSSSTRQSLAHVQRSNGAQPGSICTKIRSSPCYVRVRTPHC